MITLLNERGAWQLRAAFFQHIALVAAHAGPAGLEAFLLPILEQVLTIPEGNFVMPTRSSSLSKCCLVLITSQPEPGAWDIGLSSALLFPTLILSYIYL